MNLLFIIAGFMAVSGAIGLIMAKLPVHQVLATIFNFMGLAVLYLSLEAEFMAVIQMIVYGGAVMVLFLFVIALLTARKDPMERDEDRLSGQRVAGYAIGGGFLAMLALIGLVGKGSNMAWKVNLDAGFGTVKEFGHVLLTTQVLPFELLAFILMVAVIGVIVLVGRPEQTGGLRGTSAVPEHGESKSPAGRGR